MDLNRPQNGNGQSPRPNKNRNPLARKRDERTRIQKAVGATNGTGREKKPKGKIKVSTVVGTVFLNVLKATLLVGCIVLMIGSFVGVQMIQYVVEVTENDAEILDLTTYETNLTSYIMVYDPDNPNAREEGDYIEYQELVGDENRIWVPYTEFPDNLVNAVIATEDRKFIDHHGVDFTRTVAAFVNEFIPIPGVTGGASTIDQQLVKNILKDDVVKTEDEGAFAGYKRKMREIFRAWGLNNRYTKTEIMEAYLNTIGLSERIAGVGAGAREYFNKEVKDLTLSESAMIAGITQYPSRYSPFQNPNDCRDRRDRVLGYMVDCEFITQAEADAIIGTPLGLADRESIQRETNSNGPFSYITDQVFREVVKDLQDQRGWSKETAQNYIYNGGVRIYATADLNVQAELEDIVMHGYDEGTGFFLNEERFPNYVSQLTKQEPIKNAAGQVVGYKDVRPQCAAVVINYEGELIATVGGIGEKTESLTLNRSIGAKRQVGSTMKPIAAYALGLDYGIVHYSKMVKDTPLQPKNPYKPSYNEDGTVKKDWPRNVSGRYRESAIPVMSAIAESTNTIAVQVGVWVGREAMFEFLTEILQVDLVNPDDIDLGPLVLGSMTNGISPYELAGAYMMFGGTEEYGYGVFQPLHSYSKVEDSKGAIILEPDVPRVQAIDPQTGYVMNRLLANVMSNQRFPGNAQGTGHDMLPEGEMPAIGKTGTTNEDRDRWFVGLTPYYVTTVWWGYDNDGGTNHDFFVNGKRYPTGTRNIPSNVWKELMERVQDELPVKDFPEMPDGVQVARFCTVTGELAQATCPQWTGYYTSFNVPDTCQGHPEEEPVPEG